MRTCFREQELVDDNVVRVDFVLRQLLDEALGLVQRQEFRDADADKRRLVLACQLPAIFPGVLVAHARRVGGLTQGEGDDVQGS